jgi:lysophospholipase L1-like esterase
MKFVHIMLPAALAAAGPVHAEAPQVGVVDAPCAVVARQPDVVAAYFARVSETKARGEPSPVPTPEEMKVYNDWKAELLVSDFFGLCRYDDANAMLPAAAAKRIIFFGDSITELWGADSPGFFKNDIINRGISGQTTQQMLGRFRADVIDLNPKAVHIIAGTNDIAGNTGPTSLARIEANIETMVELAQAHGIEVILGATPPAARFAWRPDIAPAYAITAYNVWLKDFARKKGAQFVDYHAALDDGQGGFRADLSGDGIHPNAAGYKIMAPLAQGAIAKIR